MPLSISLTPMLPAPPGLPPAIQQSTVGAVPPQFTSPVVNYDELSSLLVMSLTSNNSTLNFPTYHFVESVSKDLAVHKFPNKDSGRVENMGTNPSSWKIECPFTNNIDPEPARGETWQRGSLFPGVFLQLLQMLKTPGSKVMQHPLYGNVAVQVVGWEFELVAHGPRDGAFLKISLIETVADNLLPDPIPVSFITAGKTLNAIFDAVPPGFPPPPGLSLSQFFGEMGSTVQNVINYPSNVLSGIQSTSLVVNAFFSNVANSNTINQVGTFTLAQSASLAYTTQQLLKSAPLGSVFNPYPTLPGITNSNSTLSVQQTIFQNQATQNAIQSLLSCNNNSSKNPSTFLDKCIQATYDTMQYYIQMNTYQVSSVIAGLQQMLFTLQQAQSTLSTNTQNNLSNVSVQTYIPPTNMSWPQLAMSLNNTIDNLFSLNTIQNSNYVFVQAGTPINFYQAS